MIQNKDYVPLAEVTNVCSALVKKWDQRIANYKWGRCSFEERISMWASQGFLNLYSCKPIPPSNNERWFFIYTFDRCLRDILHNKKESACHLFFVDESDHFGDPSVRRANMLRPELKLPKINIGWEDLYLSLNEIARLEKKHPDFADSAAEKGRVVKKVIESESAKVEKRHLLSPEIAQKRDSTVQTKKINSTWQPNEEKEGSDLCNSNEKVEQVRVAEDENELPLKRQTTQELDTFLRLPQIIGNPKKGIVPIIPVSKSVWWAGVKSGRFPASIKLSERCTVWRLSDILALQKTLANKEN